MAKTLSSIHNQYGIAVKRICASCAFKEYSKKEGRICSLTNLNVDARFSCRRWVMSDGMMNAGRGTGTVRDIVTKEVIYL